MINLDFVSQVVEHFNSKNSTVRETAKFFSISKTTVYRYITEIKPNAKSLEILKKNKEERHSRGGQATKNKYEKKQS